MAIYKGNTKIVKLYKGSTQIVKRYKGTDLIYSASRLPAEFQEVEYLESSGTQYIDSGVLINNLELEIKSKFTILSASQPTAYYRLFGSQYNQMLMSFGTRFWYGDASNNRTDILYINDDNDHIFVGNKNGAIIDGNNYYFPSVASSIGELGNIFLFCCSLQNNTASNFIKAKLYNFEIYNNSVLVRNFVPCYRKADNVAGLYDLVNGVFYTNAGTGTFIVGGNV